MPPVFNLARRYKELLEDGLSGSEEACEIFAERLNVAPPEFVAAQILENILQQLRARARGLFDRITPRDPMAADYSAKFT